VPQPTLAQLGIAIRALREARGLTHEDLAHESGFHRVSISRIERGKQDPSWTGLTKIASALDVELIDLVRRAGKTAGR
jgi:transcriptional regulator with XRE-family HTH domain